MQFQNSAYAMFNYFSENCHEYTWEFGLHELEGLEEHATTEGLQMWHDALVNLFYALNDTNEESHDFTITV